MNSLSVSSIAENVKKSSIGQELMNKWYIRYIPWIEPDLIDDAIVELEKSMREMEQRENVGELVERITIQEMIEGIKNGSKETL